MSNVILVSDIETRYFYPIILLNKRARWLRGRESDSGARGPGFEPHDRRVVFLEQDTLSSPKVLVNIQEVVAPSKHD